MYRLLCSKLRILYFLLLIWLHSNTKVGIVKSLSIISMVLLGFGCSVKSGEKLPVDSPDKVLNVGLLIVEGVYNTELTAAMDIFHHTIFHADPAMRVFTVAPTNETITTFEGLRIIPDYALTADSLPTIDVLVVPSAEHSMDTDLENRELISFVEKVGSQTLYNVSLCDGSFVLAKAGLVDGKESTTFPDDIGRYRQTFPDLKVHEGVSYVHDGNLVTSVGGAKSFEACLYLVEVLYGKEAAIGVGKGMVIDWDGDEIPHIIK